MRRSGGREVQEDEEYGEGAYPPTIIILLALPLPYHLPSCTPVLLYSCPPVLLHSCPPDLPPLPRHPSNRSTTALAKSSVPSSPPKSRVRCPSANAAL
jgi:hypothetical protein